MTLALGVLLLAGSAIPRELELRHQSFLTASASGPGAYRQTYRLGRTFTALDADWEKHAAGADARDGVRALVRSGELRWHLADVLERVGVPDELTRIGPGAVETWKAQSAERVTALRAAARERWAKAAQRARASNLALPELGAVQRFLADAGAPPADAGR